MGLGFFRVWFGTSAQIVSRVGASFLTQWFVRAGDVNCHICVKGERFKMASVGMRTALHGPIVDDVLSANCYGSSPGACTAQSSSRCNRKAESSLRGTSIQKD